MPLSQIATNSVEHLLTFSFTHDDSPNQSATKCVNSISLTKLLPFKINVQRKYDCQPQWLIKHITSFMFNPSQVSLPEVLTFVSPSSATGFSKNFLLFYLCFGLCYDAGPAFHLPARLNCRETKKTNKNELGFSKEMHHWRKTHSYSTRVRGKKKKLKQVFM